MRFRERIERFMQGRNGPDALSRACSVASIVLLIAAVVTQSAGTRVAGSILWYVALALIIACYWRMLSRNVTQRYRENVKYLNLRDRALGFFRRELRHAGQLRTHRFFRCPRCAQRVRTPRGKGKIRVTCPRCGSAFIRRS